MSDIVKEIQRNAIIFGNEANLQRAFPSVYDGLKPSQRAALWTAYVNKYNSDKPHVKSAKLDGATIAGYWPHGSVYETFARLSQPFIMNLPLIDFHGGNGSQLGTADCAASRYTEVRLSKAAEDGFFTNIKKDTCTMQLNFSEDLEWPVTFPAIIPNLFINGSDGIGYGFAQTWQPGNLNEFTAKVHDYIKGKFNCDNIYPDYPTKGIIINKNDIKAIYETGKGSIALRGKATIEGNTIKITELPYQVYVPAFIEQIKRLIMPDKKGNIKIDGVSDIYNLSDENGMLIEIECESDPSQVLAQLYSYSSLQSNMTVNQYALIDGIPELVTLEKYIETYIKNNISTIVKEYTYDKNKALARLEIVEGLLKAISCIDDVIVDIKKSKNTDDAKNTLVSKGWTLNQAQAIVDMRLGKLANLEIVSLNKEHDELVKVVADCDKVIGDKKEQQKVFLKRLDEFTKKYGWERRTEVINIEITQAWNKPVIRTPKSEEEYIVVLKNNFIKRVKLAEYKKNKDDITVKCTGNDKVTLISDDGMMYKLVCKKISLGSNKTTGDNLDSLFGKNIIGIYTEETEGKYFVFITKNGLMKKITRENVIDVSKMIGAIVMSVDPDDKIISIIPCNRVNIEVKSKSARKENTVNIDTDTLLAKGRPAGGTKKVKGDILSIAFQAMAEK